MSTRAARRRGEKPSFWRGRGPLLASLALVAAIVVGFAWIGRSAPAATATAADAAAVAATMTTIPAAAFDAVGGGSVRQSLAKGGGQTLRIDGKPAILYVGADFCPFCASERWALVAALARFGTFGGLELERSSPTDVFPDTATFSFRGVSYRSDLLAFAPVETADRDGRPITHPSPVQQASMTAYNSRGSIPYLSLADRWYLVGAGVPPDAMAGKDWRQIAREAADPSTVNGKAVLGHANQIAAALCVLTDGKPAAVCGAPGLTGLRPPS